MNKSSLSGRFAHLPPDQLERLEEEVKTAAEDSEKSKDLEEFLKAVQEDQGEKRLIQSIVMEER